MNELKYHKSCKTLSIYAFNEIQETGDLKHLLKDYDSDADIKPSDAMILQATWKMLVREYHILSDSVKYELGIKSKISVGKLEMKIEAAQILLDNYDEYGFDEVLERLNKLKGFKFDKNKPVDPQVNVAKSKLSGLKTKLAIKKKSKEEKHSESTQTLDDIALILSMNLGLNYSINTMKTSVSQWCSLVRACKNKKA